MGNITQVLAVTVFGVLIVFAVLIILMLILNLMKLFAPSDEAEVKEESPTSAPALVTESKAEAEDEDELIAVLAAAVAASINTPVSGFKIRSYKRLS